MKMLLVLLAFAPVLLLGQSKKKRALAAAQAKAALVANIKTHLQYLTDDKLEGRRTGTHGEEMAMDYIIAQYQNANIAPKGDSGYVQSFEINEGKKIGGVTGLWVNDKPALLNKHYFPLAYSANKSVKTSVAMSLNEAGNIWFKDIKDWLEDNQDNPHFNLEDNLKKYVAKVSAKGAIALFIYNSGTKEDNIQFNKYDSSATATIPVLFITKDGLNEFFKDNTATQDVSLSVSIGQQVRTGHNVVAFINNNAPNTVILGAHYDHLGYGEDKNALDTGHLIHHGADDNASGTAALIELAKKLNTAPAKNNNYLIIHFSGEELGCLGSKYWLQHRTTDAPLNYMINMDMVGRYDTINKLFVGGYGTSPQWDSIFNATSNSILKLKFGSGGNGRSDHINFYRANIPVLFFFTGEGTDYHKATDTWDKINYDGEVEIINYIYRIITTTDTKGKLGFTSTNATKIKPRVSLNIVADASFDGWGPKVKTVLPETKAKNMNL